MTVQLQAIANVPIQARGGTRICQIRMYSEEDGTNEVMAIVHCSDPDETPVIRLHSACLTGEVLGSLKCDCGSQLQIALDAITSSPHGIVLYFTQHEGRGIGLINKIRAYAHQEHGLDTVEANLALGLEADSRTFSAAPTILGDLGVETVRLLTNNPDKTRALTDNGIDVAEIIPMPAVPNQHNLGYLEKKVSFFGHEHLVGAMSL